MSPRRTFRLVDWLLATIIGAFLVGAVIAQAHGAPIVATARAWAWPAAMS
jgi:hypothetical protein